MSDLHEVLWALWYWCRFQHFEFATAERVTRRMRQLLNREQRWCHALNVFEMMCSIVSDSGKICFLGNIFIKRKLIILWLCYFLQFALHLIYILITPLSYSKDKGEGQSILRGVTCFIPFASSWGNMWAHLVRGLHRRLSVFAYKKFSTKDLIPIIFRASKFPEPAVLENKIETRKSSRSKCHQSYLVI
jgi:hypothetical protein